MPRRLLDLTAEQSAAYDRGEPVTLRAPGERIENALCVATACGKHLYFVYEGTLRPDGFLQFHRAAHLRGLSGEPLTNPGVTINQGTGLWVEGRQAAFRLVRS